jgi:hypothetical protein
VKRQKKSERADRRGLREKEENVRVRRQKKPQ